MNSASRTRFFFTLCAALCLFGIACDTAFAFPKSALAPADRGVLDIVIMAMSALLGVAGGLWVFLRTRSKKPWLR